MQRTFAQSRARSASVASSSDYVFADDYRLAPLGEVENHIRVKRRIPGIPTAAEVEAGGGGLGQMQAKLLGKVKELPLSQIAQMKANSALHAETVQLNSSIARLER